MSKIIRVFLGEDHLAIREMLAAYLQVTGKVTVVGQAGDGRDVIQKCLELKPDLLILDLDLPGLNGVTTARRLGAELPGMPILIFSSHYDRAVVREVLETGVRGIIEKTAPATALLEAVEMLAAGKAYFSEKVTQIIQQSFADPAATRSADGLTPREREVLQLVAEGLSNKEIASRLNNSVKTIENHRHHIMRKLNARNGADLTREAFRLGLVRRDAVPRDAEETSLGPTS